MVSFVDPNIVICYSLGPEECLVILLLATIARQMWVPDTLVAGKSVSSKIEVLCLHSEARRTRIHTCGC